MTMKKAYYGLLPSQRVLQIAKEQAERESLYLGCKRLLNSMYAPSVSLFMMALAVKRDRLQYLRDLLSIGLKVDDIRRLVISDSYTPPNLIISAMSHDRANFFGDIPFSHRGRFGNLWQRLCFRIRYWREKYRRSG